MVFKGVPIPPSSNNQYLMIRARGKILHVPSPELKRFRLAMEHYFLEQSDAVKFAREIFVGHPLSIHCAFAFEKSRLVSKKGSFKRLDVSNRLKALHDAFADALLIDDCAFVNISAKKYAVQKEMDEQVTVEIAVAEFEEML